LFSVVGSSITGSSTISNSFSTCASTKNSSSKLSSESSKGSSISYGVKAKAVGSSTKTSSLISGDSLSFS